MSLAAHARDLSASLAKAGLVPGSAPLIPDTFTPSTQVTVSFGEKVVQLGNLFRASECKTAPSVEFTAEVRLVHSCSLFALPCYSCCESHRQDILERINDI